MSLNPLQPDCDDDTSGICSAMQFCRQPSVCGVFFAQWPQKCPLLQLHAFSDATITACARACVPRHKLARYFWRNYNFMHYCVLEGLRRLYDHRRRTRHVEGTFITYNGINMYTEPSVVYHGKERFAWARRCLQRQVGPVATFVTISTSDDIAGDICA